MKQQKIKFDPSKILTLVFKEEEFKTIAGIEAEPIPEQKQEKVGHEYSTRRKDNKAKESKNGAQLSASNGSFVSISTSKTDIKVPETIKDESFYQNYCHHKKVINQDAFIKVISKKDKQPDPGIYEATDADLDFLKKNTSHLDLKDFEFAICYWEELSAATGSDISISLAIEELKNKGLKSLDPKDKSKQIEIIFNYWVEQRELLKRPLIRKYFKINYQKENRNPNFAFRPRKEQKMKLRKIRGNEEENLKRLNIIKEELDIIKHMAYIVRLREELKLCHHFLDFYHKNPVRDDKNFLIDPKEYIKKASSKHDEMKNLLSKSYVAHPPKPVEVVQGEVKPEPVDIDYHSMVRFVASLSEELSAQKIPLVNFTSQKFDELHSLVLKHIEAKKVSKGNVVMQPAVSTIKKESLLKIRKRYSNGQIIIDRFWNCNGSILFNHIYEMTPDIEVKGESRQKSHYANGNETESFLASLKNKHYGSWQEFDYSDDEDDKFKKNHANLFKSFEKSRKQRKTMDPHISTISQFAYNS